MNEATMTCTLLTMNRLPQLRACLQSIMAQADPPESTLVVDNGSTDGSDSMVSTEFPMVRLVRLDCNVGVAEGRNVILDSADTDLVMMIDDDGTLDRNAVHVARTFLSNPANQDVGVLSLTLKDPGTGESYPLRTTELLHEHYTYGCGSCVHVVNALGTERYPGFFWESGSEFDMAIRLIDKGYRIIKHRDCILWHDNSRCLDKPYRLRLFGAQMSAGLPLGFSPCPWSFPRFCANARSFSFGRCEVSTAVASCRTFAQSYSGHWPAGPSEGPCGCDPMSSTGVWRGTWTR